MIKDHENNALRSLLALRLRAFTSVQPASLCDAACAMDARAGVGHVFRLESSAISNKRSPPWREDSMPTEATPSLQLDFFLRDTTAYQQALARYDRLRPILQGQATLTQQSQATGISSNQLWRDLQRLQHAGLVGLLNHRPLPPTRGMSSLDARIPLHVQHQI